MKLKWTWTGWLFVWANNGLACASKLLCVCVSVPFHLPQILKSRRYKFGTNSIKLQFSMDTVIPAVDDIGIAETSAGTDMTLCDSDINQEPHEGMLFESEEAATAFYDEYAGRIGFATRVLSSRRSERDGSIISRGLGCKGGPDNQKTDSGSTRKRDRQRKGCTAMFLVKRERSGGWVVRKFVSDHNHSLSATLPRRRPAYDERDKRIQELTTELRVKKRLSAAYREQLLTLMKDVECHNEHLLAKVQAVQKNLKEIEAQREELSLHR